MKLPVLRRPFGDTPRAVLGQAPELFPTLRRRLERLRARVS